MNNSFMRDIFLTQIYENMKTDEMIFLITADLGSPVIDRIKSDFPKRFLNVGIAEQNLINVSVGLSLEGYVVFAYGITPFVTMRCYEQIRVNMSILSAMRPLNINLIGMSVGTGYAMSGPTHHTLEDLSIMRVLPNIEIFSPSDNLLVKKYFQRSLKIKKPKYLRLDTFKPALLENQVKSFNKGFRILQNSSEKTAVISTGFMVQKVYEIVKKMDVTLVDLYFINAYSKKELLKALQNVKTIVTIEEGFKNSGGLDSEISFLFKDKKLINLGFEKHYIFDIGDREFVHKKNGLGIDEIKKQIKKAMHCSI